MRRKYSLNEKRRMIIEFIRKNPNTTYRLIREKIKLHPERIFGSLENAFKEAKIKPPRTFEKKTKEEKRKIMINYIKENPRVGGHTIRKNLKINFTDVFKNIQEAYEIAEISYPRIMNNKLRSRKKEERREKIIDLVKKNPNISITEISKITKCNPYRIFRNIKEIYEVAGIKKNFELSKRRINKQNQIIEFIQQNPTTTQREINKICKSHVQEMFDGGIIKAYEKAGIKFPFERLKLYGIGLEETRKRAKTFEEEIAVKLSGYGNVNRLVKTKRGFADIIFERKDKKAIIEVKDYLNKDISLSEVKQLNKYLEDCFCNLGFLICHKKPKKDKFLIRENKIFLLDDKELNKIPEIIDGSVV